MKLKKHIWISAAAVFLLLLINVHGTEIHEAVIAGDLDRTVQAIERNSPAIDQADANGKTALHIAVEKGNTALADLLLTKGADPAMKDRAGKTPLRLAIDANSDACVAVLVGKTSAGYVDALLDTRQQEGQAALKDGTLARANTMLGRLVRIDPAGEGVNFAYGISWLSLGDPAPAGVAFERLLQINPSNHRARAELARARIAARRYAEAKEELEKVLAADLPPGVKESVEACLRDVKNHTERSVFSGIVELGLLYDSNVNMGPDSDMVHISPVTIFGTTISELQVLDGSKPTDTAGFFASATARTSYDIGEAGNWLLLADASAYRNWLEEDDFETENIQAGAGVKTVLERGYLSVPYRMRYIGYSGSPLAWIHGLYPAFAYAPEGMNGLSLTTLASAELWDFDQYSARDGYYLSIGEVVRKALAGGKRSVYGGAELQFNDADSRVYEYGGIGLMAGVEAILPHRISAVVETRYFSRSYAEKEPLAPEKRRDGQFIVSAAIMHRVSDRVTVSLRHNLVENNSTFELYEYTRNITTLSTSAAF